MTKPAPDALPDRPLEPPEPGERQVMKWVAALLGLSILSAGWLAARADSPVGVRQALDTILQLGLAGLFLAGAYRLLTYYPYRLLDLLTMILVLSLGLKLALDALPAFQEQEPGQIVTQQQQFGPLALSCTLVCSVLLCGAALGLRYCSRLKLERARLRVMAILYGMLAFPAAVGFFAFPALTLGSMAQDEGADVSTLLYLSLSITSFLVVVRNAVLLFRSMALDDDVEIKRNESSVSP